MRKIIVSMNVTLDGFMAGPGDELDWHFARWTEDMAEYLGMQLSQADTILLGRTTYNAMAAYWPDRGNDLAVARDDLAFADMMNNYTKVVFSKTLTRLRWRNSRLLKGNLSKEVQKLKEESGRDIMVFGSGRLVAGLMLAGLVDEYILWVHPVVLSKGKPLFANLHNRLDMKFTRMRKFNSGVIVLFYRTVARAAVEETV